MDRDFAEKATPASSPAVVRTVAAEA